MTNRSEVVKQIHGDPTPVRIYVHTTHEPSPSIFEGNVWRIEFRPTHIRIVRTNSSNVSGAEHYEWLFPINVVKCIEVIGVYS